MSKIIKLTPQYIAECTKEFEQSLATSKWADGKISFSKTLGTITRKAKLYFTDLAWTKMQTLIKEFDKEVAWHGVAVRGDDGTKDEYYITDILVYPQEVSGASVEMDTAKYATWIMENADDDRFSHIGMQGHSHVNMAVTPSSVDLTHQEAILDQLTDDMFYVFMIWNKRGERNIKIYDLAKNVLFETADVDVEIMDDGYGIDAFIKDAKAMVKEKTYTSSQGYQGYQYYNQYYKPSTSGSTAVSTVAPDKKENENKDISLKKDDKSSTAEAGKSGKKKGKKKKKKHSYFTTLHDDVWPV